MMIGEKIVRYRTENNISQTELAKKLEIDRTYLSKVENGKKTASRNLLNKLIKETGYGYKYWTQRFLEITCSKCGEIARKEVRSGNNHIRIKCSCGAEKELVVVTSKKIEIAYEVQEVHMNLENLSLEKIEEDDIVNKRIIKLFKAGYEFKEVLKKITTSTNLTYEDVKWKIKDLKKRGSIKKK